MATAEGEVLASTTEDGTALDLGATAQRYIELRLHKDDLEAQLKATQELLDVAENDLLFTMENLNMQSFRDKDHGLVYVSPDVRVKIEDEAATFAWFERNDLSDVIKRTIHNRTLCAMVKERKKDGLEDIPGVLVGWGNRINFRRK